MVDKDLVCIVVSVYNLAQGRGPVIGDSVAIPEPYLSQIDVTYKNQVCFFLNGMNLTKFVLIRCIFHFQKFNYPSLRVNLPLTMVVNKKSVSAECVSQPQFLSKPF